MRKKVIIMLLVLSVLTSFTGCKVTVPVSDSEAEKEDESVVQTVDKVEKEDSSGFRFEDNGELYSDDDTSVVTMYLTVSKGNVSEATNHTWKEVNGHSTYYYANKGIKQYSVNGLLQVGNEEGPVSGHLGYGEKTPNAIVTIRGKSSSKNPQKSYKIKIKDGKGSWNEQRIINLNKHPGDGVRFRNKMEYSILQKLDGLASMQTQFVHLYVKDETESEKTKFKDYGLYTQVEQPNKNFLKRHGFDKNGQLYKLCAFEFYRYEDTIMLKSDSKYNKGAFEKLLEIKGNNDHSKLIAMLDDLNNYSVSIENVLDKWFDKNNVISWLAYNILTGNTDTQCQNTLLYSPLNEKKWYLLNWDCDGAFSNTENRILGKHDQTGWERGISNYWGNKLFQRILKSKKLRKSLDDKIKKYCKILSKSYLKGLVKKYSKVTSRYAFKDPDIVYEPLTKAEYIKVCQGIPNEVKENYKDYLETLKRPMPFFIGLPVYKDGKTNFKWDNSYDFSTENIYYTIEVADNLKFKNPIIKKSGLFVSEYTYDGKLKKGQYFIRISAKNELGKKQYAFDYYMSDGNVKNYGVKSIYIQQDGSVREETYEQ